MPTRSASSGLPHDDHDSKKSRPEAERVRVEAHGVMTVLEMYPETGAVVRVVGVPDGCKQSGAKLKVRRAQALDYLDFYKVQVGGSPVVHALQSSTFGIANPTEFKFVNEAKFALHTCVDALQGSSGEKDVPFEAEVVSVTEGITYVRLPCIPPRPGYWDPYVLEADSVRSTPFIMCVDRVHVLESSRSELHIPDLLVVLCNGGDINVSLRLCAKNSAFVLGPANWSLRFDGIDFFADGASFSFEVTPAVSLIFQASGARTGQVLLHAAPPGFAPVTVAVFSIVRIRAMPGN